MLVAFRNPKPYCANSSPLQVKRVKLLDITEVARRCGLAASTLRFYERKG
jgi:hypothetical protein